MEIYSVAQRPELVKKCVNFIWGYWGSEENHNFYTDAIQAALNPDSLPQFYVAIKDDEVVGSYALLTNDLNSRQDLWPWFGCLYVKEAHQKEGIAGKLLDHSLIEAKRLRFDTVYLSTDLDGFYEKKGWSIFGECFNASGQAWKIYCNTTD